MKIIKTIEYSGSINNFRAFMDEIVLLHQEIWEVENRNYYHLRDTTYEKQYRSMWDIVEATEGGIIWARVKCGVILALEKSKDQTTVQFIDGKTVTGLFMTGHDNAPIGDDFLVIVDRITGKLENKVHSERDDKNEPLDKIPNVGWYREAVKLWREGKTSGEIAAKIGKNEQTVRNKIAELRKLYGDNIVPKRR